MQQLKAFPGFALAIFAMLAVPMAASAASAAQSNICDAGELWEGACVLEEDWIAGWYLHPDNDSGDGAAVETAYANFADVIIHMPHSMCIDWRSANCDGSIPPAPPVYEDEVASRNVRRKLTGSARDCIVQAHFQASIGQFCRLLIAYDATLTDGDAGFNAKTLAARRTFIAGLPTRSQCSRSAAYIVARGEDYSAGNLQEPQVVQIEADIVAVQSWACATYRNQTPPAIPDAPGS